VAATEAVAAVSEAEEEAGAEASEEAVSEATGAKETEWGAANGMDVLGLE